MLRYKLRVLPLNYRGIFVKYIMTNEQIAFEIKKRIEQLPHKYDTVSEQMLYEQGILLGLLATLSYYDSKNLDLILKQLSKLK